MKEHSVALLSVLLLSMTAWPVLPTPSPSQSSTNGDTGHGNVAAPAGAASEWKTYRNEKNGFEIKYPAAWRVGGGSTTSGSGSSEMIDIGEGFHSGASRAYLTVAIQKGDNPKKLSIDDWFAEQMRVAKTPGVTGHITVGGRAAVFIEVTNSTGKDRYRSIYTALHETDILTLIYVRSKEFDPVYERMLASLRFLK